MKLKNRDIIELAKFFLMNPDSSRIEMDFRSHQIMKVNIEIFKEVLLLFSNIEQDILALKNSPLSLEFKKDLDILVQDYLEKNEDGSNVTNPDGTNPICNGCETNVAEANAALSDDEKYKELIKEITDKEIKYRNLQFQECEKEITPLDPLGISIQGVKTSMSVWDTFSLLISDEDQQ